MRLVLLGPPGAGKGTQSQLLTERLCIPKISTGEMLREAAERGTAVGLAAKVFTARGQLVPDATVLELVQERLQRSDARGGYLLDGFPRTVDQAEAFDHWLAEHRQALNAAIDLQVSSERIVERISNRRVCPNCHETYHLLARPPRQHELCDECGTALAQRDDDRAEVVRARLEVYLQRTEPVLGYYRRQGLLTAIPGDQPVDCVTAAILDVLHRRRGGA